MDLNEISAFVSIVQAGGLSRAAEQTGLPKSTLSRKLQQLEKRLGVTLLQRTTRKITLTRAGEEYFRTCSQLISQLDEAEKLVLLEQQEPQGLLRFTAPAEAGSTVLAPVIKKFCDRHPRIALDIDFTDRIVDLIGEGFDVALRAGVQKDSSLKARKIARERFVLVASPHYLKRQGSPKDPRDLSQHRLIGFSPTRENLVWKLTSPSGRSEISLQKCFRSNSLGNCKSLAQEGLGIALLPQFQVQSDFQNGILQAVLPNWHQDRGEFCLVYPNQTYLPPKTRVFIDFFSEELKKLFAVT